mgnify:CR=1 FL=1
MKRYTIEQKFKSAAAFLVILILFPYIVSVFVNGVDPEETTNEKFFTSELKLRRKKRQTGLQK